MKRLKRIASLLGVGVLAMTTLGGCAVVDSLKSNPTVVAVVDGIRVACGWEAASTDVQALLNAGIPGLSTVANYVGAFCAAANNLPVSAARAAGPQPINVGGVPMKAQRVVK